MSDDNKEYVDPIVRKVGERVIVDGGRDYSAPTARVILSTFSDAGEEERAVYISQGKVGISVSLQTLQAIINWAKQDQ